MRNYRIVKHVFLPDNEEPVATLTRYMTLPTSVYPSMVIQDGAYIDTVQLLGYAVNEFAPNDEGEWELLVTPMIILEEDLEETLDTLRDRGFSRGDGTVRFLDAVTTGEGECDCEDCDCEDCDNAFGLFSDPEADITGLDIEGFGRS